MGWEVYDVSRSMPGWAVNDFIDGYNPARSNKIRLMIIIRNIYWLGKMRGKSKNMDSGKKP